MFTMATLLMVTLNRRIRPTEFLPHEKGCCGLIYPHWLTFQENARDMLEWSCET